MDSSNANLYWMVEFKKSTDDAVTAEKKRGHSIFYLEDASFNYVLLGSETKDSENLQISRCAINKIDSTMFSLDLYEIQLTQTSLYKQIRSIFSTTSLMYLQIDYYDTSVSTNFFATVDFTLQAIYVKEFEYFPNYALYDNYRIICTRYLSEDFIVFGGITR